MERRCGRETMYGKSAAERQSVQPSYQFSCPLRLKEIHNTSGTKHARADQLPTPDRLRQTQNQTHPQTTIRKRNAQQPMPAALHSTPPHCATTNNRTQHRSVHTIDSLVRLSL